MSDSTQLYSELETISPLSWMVFHHNEIKKGYRDAAQKIIFFKDLSLLCFFFFDHFVFLGTYSFVFEQENTTSYTPVCDHSYHKEDRIRT